MRRVIKLPYTTAEYNAMSGGTKKINNIPPALHAHVARMSPQARHLAGVGDSIIPQTWEDVEKQAGVNKKRNKKPFTPVAPVVVVPPVKSIEVEEDIKETPPLVETETPSTDLPTEAAVKKSPMKKWPENPSELLPYSDIVNPLKEVIRKGYRLLRKEEVKNFDYEGYNIGKLELQSHPSPRARLSEKLLEYEKELGHTLLDVVLNMMFLMGVEQGRRAERRDSKPMDSLLETLEVYREKNKNQRIRIDELEVILNLKEKYPDISEEEFKEKIRVGISERRDRRIKELREELQLDASRSTFQFKTTPRAKFKELEQLARSLSKETCTEDQWKVFLQERGWTQKEWKNRCKKKSVKTDFS